ncbi:MAG: bifunctional diaminohydroxyphosphoribosylaminopyrimidine deaminase/5-amino-6-(5-phosphoribosylamino)uracil reductase RibD [Deltaproteobacteria bacterium]|nr:bifunctional diaminohydroxyphosphoribosylaminopyrimidine deaminase/5-amino-6-(5-phosphoribosylamino)uracil reductase RibD [Deltaproteobacteria bacterium]MBZ0220577.1 bifunctional diaminohydroxyphosphoribosylaminopyrimidine deaminase/5-amino-6-(5-phosphoribosylamino)uracil reductase RibD [Deltaproteobacteria bacterium]
MARHEDFMRAALKFARKGLGRTSPNPAVGAVIVRSGRIISSGWHRKAGLPHAEIEALSGAAGDLKNAVMYVTLEPCCHYGRTPPCTEALIRSGVRKVVIGALDPNPQVSGKGARSLRKAGIEVVSGVLEEECMAVNEAYTSYIRSRTPFVTLKLASSLDGRIATSTGESRWITGPLARKRVHSLRSVNDAVMVGRRTVERDDPELTVRLAKGRDPIRVVLDSNLLTPSTASVYNGVKEGKARLIFFVTSRASSLRIKKARENGAQVVRVAASGKGVSVKNVLRELGKREITSVLVEGGGELASSLIQAGLVDKYVLFYGPVIIGGDGKPSVASIGLKGLAKAPRLERVTAKAIDGGVVVEGYPAWKEG